MQPDWLHLQAWIARKYVIGVLPMVESAEGRNATTIRAMFLESARISKHPQLMKFANR